MKNLKSISMATVLTLMSTTVIASETPIVGNVESKCSIFSDKQGVYGNPTSNALSTAPADGGVKPVIRYDVVQGGYYTAKISYPTDFSSSPSLGDSVTWTGDIAVKEVSDAAMANYETNKVTYNNTAEYDLTVTGTVWFDLSSTAQYGFNKAFPAGAYTAVVTAECIAK